MSRRAYVIGLLLLFAALLAAWLLRAASHQPAAGRVPVSASASGAPESSGAAALPSSVPALSSRGAARAQRDALRAAIVHSLAEAEPAAAVVATKPETAPSPAPVSGTLKDRLGGREALVKALSQQFMPLAQDCIERAQREKPALRGLLGLSLHTLADAEHGAVVDVAEAAASNQIEDSALWECIRESAYSLSLPPPPSHGREAFELTIPVDAAGDLGTVPPPSPR